MSDHYSYGDILSVRKAEGRIEREVFVVTGVNKVSGGGYRYQGIFPGLPSLTGKIYTEDIVGWVWCLSEKECNRLEMEAR